MKTVKQLTAYLDEKISWLYEHPKDEVSLRTHIEELEKIRDTLKIMRVDTVMMEKENPFSGILSEQG